MIENQIYLQQARGAGKNFALTIYDDNRMKMHFAKNSPFQTTIVATHNNASSSRISNLSPALPDRRWLLP